MDVKLEKRLKTLIDSTARDLLSIFVRNGKRGLEVALRYNLKKL